MSIAQTIWASDGKNVVGIVGEPVPAESGVLATEAELIGGVRKGDSASMATLYQCHRAPALKLARSLVARPEDAEDIVHEAFANAVRAIRNGFGPSDTFAPYLNTCVRSVATNTWHRQARERTSPFEDLDTIAAAVEDPALETVLSVFEHEHVAAAMRTLPERWRTVLWHAEVMGEPPRNIAPLLGIESNAVSSLLIRARAGLRAAYEQQTLPVTESDGVVRRGLS